MQKVCHCRPIKALALRGSTSSPPFPPSAPLSLPPGGRALIPTGLIMEVTAGYEAQVRPRSGLALNHGVTVLNAPGTIDSDYRGEVGVILVNHGEDPFEIIRGARIAQLVVAPAPQARLVLAEDVSKTIRGEGGFGSTGRNASSV